MRAFNRYQIALGLLMVLGGYLTAMTAAEAQCLTTVRPSFRFGPVNVPRTGTMNVTLTVLTFPTTSAPPTMQLTFRRTPGARLSTVQLKSFDVCVVPNRQTALPLYSRVLGTLHSPPLSDPTAQLWQFFFGGVFINPLNRNSGMQGQVPVVLVPVDAQNLNNQIPPGVQPYAQMLITVRLNGATFNLNLTVQRR